MDMSTTLADLEKQVARMEESRKELSDLITAKRRDVRSLRGIIERAQPPMAVLDSVDPDKDAE